MLLERSRPLTGAGLGAAAEQTECSGTVAGDAVTELLSFTKPPVCNGLETNRIGPLAPRAWERLEQKGGADRQGKGTDEGPGADRGAGGPEQAVMGAGPGKHHWGQGARPHTVTALHAESKSTQPPRRKTEGQNIKATVLIFYT